MMQRGYIIQSALQLPPFLDRVLTVWEEPSGLRLVFTERCDCGYGVPIVKQIFRFCMRISVT